MREYKFDINAIDLTFPLAKSSIICILSSLYLNTLNILKRVQKMLLQDKFWKQKYYNNSLESQFSTANSHLENPLSAFKKNTYSWTLMRDDPWKRFSVSLMCQLE